MTPTDVFIKKGRGSVPGPVSRSGTAGNKLEALPPAQADQPVSSGWQWRGCPAVQLSAEAATGGHAEGRVRRRGTSWPGSGDTLRCPA